MYLSTSYELIAKSTVEVLGEECFQQLEIAHSPNHLFTMHLQINSNSILKKIINISSIVLFLYILSEDIILFLSKPNYTSNLIGNWDPGHFPDIVLCPFPAFKKKNKKCGFFPPPTQKCGNTFWGKKIVSYIPLKMAFQPTKTG